MRKIASAALIAAASFVSAQPALATPINLSGYVDNNISTYTDGSAYPGPGLANVAGIDFQLAGFGGGTGIIRDVASSSESPQAIDITVDQTGVGKLFAIVNSADGGQTGSNVGSIVLNAVNGASETITLIEGTNIRDHYSGSFNNTTASLYGTQNYPGGAHFDVYEYDLPSSFANTLASVDFTSYELGFPYGSPFIAGLTTEAASVSSAAPEPGTWIMMILGFGLIGSLMRFAYRKSEDNFTAKVRSIAT